MRSVFITGIFLSFTTSALGAGEFDQSIKCLKAIGYNSYDPKHGGPQETRLADNVYAVEDRPGSFYFFDPSMAYRATLKESKANSYQVPKDNLGSVPGPVTVLNIHVGKNAPVRSHYRVLVNGALLGAAGPTDGGKDITPLDVKATEALDDKARAVMTAYLKKKVGGLFAHYKEMSPTDRKPYGRALGACALVPSLSAVVEDQRAKFATTHKGKPESGDHSDSDSSLD